MALALLVTLAPAAQGVSPRLLRAAPAESVAAVFVQPADVEGPSPPSAVWQWAGGALSGFGEAGVVADAIATGSVLRGYPWAFVLTDVRAVALGEGSHRLNEMQAAIVVDTGGEHGPITQQIQALLTHWTQAGTARIEAQTVQNWETHALVDERLPAWARLRWCAAGDYYVIALGDRAFHAVLGTIARETPPITTNAWFAGCQADVGLTHADIAWYIDFAALRHRLAPVMVGKPTAVLAELGLADTDRGLWTVGHQGRAIVATAALSTSHGERLVPICRPMASTDPDRLVIPDAAAWYARINYPAGRLVTRCVQAYLASRRPSVQENLRRAWQAFETDAGISIREDLLGQLGDRWVLHGFPPHPSGMPFLCTIAVKMEGDAGKVRAAMDALMTQCRRWLRPERRTTEAENSSRSLGDVLATTLERAPDGVWGLRMGIHGPALAVTDKWIIVSFAPRAVRQNLARLNANPVPEDGP